MRARSHAVVTLLPLMVGVSAWSGHVDARAAEDFAALGDRGCQFDREGSTLRLRGDCSTRSTIVIPDGFTLDGQRHRITAIDPRGGIFRGPVLTNAGRSAHVRAVTVRAVELAPRCGAHDTLSAIALQDCSGSVSDSVVEGVYRRGLACGDGTGISVRASSERDRADARVVWITGNRIEGFARAGVAIEGPLEANVHLNRITGSGAHGAPSQQGVSLARGATGSVRWNVVRTLAHGVHGALSTGVVVRETPGPVELALNRVEHADVGVGLLGAGGTRVEDNALRDQRRAAIRVDGRDAPATDNRIRNNRVGAVPVGVLIEGALARENDVSPGTDLDLLPGTVQEIRGAHGNLIHPE